MKLKKIDTFLKNVLKNWAQVPVTKNHIPLINEKYKTIHKYIKNDNRKDAFDFSKRSCNNHKLCNAKTTNPHKKPAAKKVLFFLTKYTNKNNGIGNNKIINPNEFEKEKAQLKNIADSNVINHE